MLLAAVILGGRRREGERPSAVPAASASSDLAVCTSAAARTARRAASRASAAVGVSRPAAALLADAAEARRQGDLRTTLALLQAAVAGTPSVETHAALGGLYFELGAAGPAVRNLRAAADGDPADADRWIALANALVLAPDPFAAAEALDHARRAEPGLRVRRDGGGWIVREPPAPDADPTP
ncbi:MAG: hypothetical protein KIT14_10260 [bacterium]|nr:hypothetical protein [bacterium]